MADKLVWYLKETEKKTTVKKMLGFKNVSIKTNNEVAFSDKAIYNNETEICKLFGNVRLQRGESFLLGEYAEVDLKVELASFFHTLVKCQMRIKLKHLLIREV